MPDPLKSTFGNTKAACIIGELQFAKYQRIWHTKQTQSAGSKIASNEKKIHIKSLVFAPDFTEGLT